MINSANVTELKTWLDNNDEIVLIDCREQNEWDEGHIGAAKFIPLSDFQAQFSNTLTNKDAKIVMQCRSGKRSLQACQILMQEGFSDLYNLEGGILAWQEAGFEVTRD